MIVRPRAAGGLSPRGTAFDATMKDPALLADAKKRRMDITHRTGKEVEAAIADMFKASPSVIARAREMLKY